ALGVLSAPEALPALRELRTCDAPVEHFERGRLLLCTVGELAQCAAQRIEARCLTASGSAMPDADVNDTAA
ncbi:HEAT repeat domain-containing protein, partial [Desulfovibrio oxamicus]|nr:HEAT repeat domain-containing protein [Nitratidesulfovibrio oxamicus]